MPHPITAGNFCHATHRPRTGPQVRLRLARRTAAQRSAGRDVRDRDLRRQHRLLQDAGGPGDSRQAARLRSHRRRWPTRSPARSIVEGAKKGDTLVVEIESITVDRLFVDRRRPAPRTARRIDALAGTLGRTTRRKIFQHTPGPSGTTRDGTLHFSDRRSVGRSRRSSARSASRPDREVTTSLDGQGDWGGNLDIRDVAPGNTHPCCRSITRARCSTWATSTPARATRSSPARRPRRSRRCG